MTPVIFYVTYAYPNMEEFFILLDKLDSMRVPFVEIGIPVLNPFMDGEIIRNTHKKVLEQESFDTLEKKLNIIRDKYNFKTIIMTYKSALDKFELKGLCKKYSFGLLCVDEDIQDENIEVIKLYNSNMTNEEIDRQSKNNGLFAYLMSYTGKTGESNPDMTYVKILPTLRKKLSIPIYVGFGVASVEEVKRIIASGSDGAIIGSELLRRVEEGQESVDRYLEKFVF